MNNPWSRVRDFFLKDLWAIDRSALGPVRRLLLDALRLIAVIVRDILYGQITLWAMGLVYTTLMSLVPLLAVAFSVLKAFGVQNKLEPFLLNLVAPLGPNGEVIVHRIVEFVNNMRVGVLGIVGLGLLMYTVMSLIQKVEQAFNTIWNVRGERSVLRQFTEYLSVVLAGPVLVVAALAITASFMSTSFVRKLILIQPFGALVAAAGNLIPYVLVCASFTFLYIFLPNTRVRWTAAIVGGIVGGVLWESVGWGFASFIVVSTRYAAIYSSFAILILFMTWLYLSWLILLVGCEVTFYLQNPQLLLLIKPMNLPDARLIEQTALAAMFLIALHFFRGRPPWTAGSLVERLGVSIAIEPILAALRMRGLIFETESNPPTYVPGRDLSTIRLQDVYDAVRVSGTAAGPGARGILAPPAVDAIVRKVDEAIAGVLQSVSLEEIVRSAEPEEEIRQAA